MDASHLPPRRTAFLALGVLLLALGAAVVLESGQVPVTYALRANGPLVALATLPLVYMVVALRRAPSRSALALGFAYPVAILLSFAFAVRALYQSGTEGQMEVLFSLFFFWASPTRAIFLVVFLPVMMRLAIVSRRAYRSSFDGMLAPAAVWTIAMMIAINAARVPVRAAVDNVPEYRPDVVDNAIAPLNECIWRAAGPGAEAGFPNTLGEIRHVPYRVYPTSATPPRDECAEQLDQIPTHPFDVSYEAGDRDAAGRARRFTLRLTEKTRAGGRPNVVWVDETGLRREGVGVGDRVDSVRVKNTSSLETILLLQHDIDEYAAQHRGEPPSRIVADFRVPEGAAPPAAALVADIGECDDAEGTANSCIEKWEHSIIYAPVRDATGRVSAYTLTMHPATYYDYERPQPIPTRTHHRDASGMLHSFGGFRPANANDPAPAQDEMARARRSIDRLIEDRAKERAREQSREPARDARR